jgi:hypothetical protein
VHFIEFLCDASLAPIPELLKASPNRILLEDDTQGIFLAIFNRDWRGIAEIIRRKEHKTIFDRGPPGAAPCLSRRMHQEAVVVVARRTALIHAVYGFFVISSERSKKKNSQISAQRRFMGGRIATAWHCCHGVEIFHGVEMAAWMPGYRKVTMTSINFLVMTKNRTISAFFFFRTF